jgi:hypothetical protein
MIKHQKFFAIAGIAVMNIFATSAIAGGYRAERVCDCYEVGQQCGSWRGRHCGEQVHRRYPGEVPDNTRDPWSIVPFDPDKVWERIQRISPG